MLPHTVARPLANESIMAPAEPNVDYYAILEISNLATIDAVTKSYRRLAKIRHPDKNPSNDATAVFQLVSPVTIKLVTLNQGVAANSFLRSSKMLMRR